MILIVVKFRVRADRSGDWLAQVGPFTEATRGEANSSSRAATRFDGDSLRRETEERSWDDLCDRGVQLSGDSPVDLLEATRDWERATCRATGDDATGNDASSDELCATSDMAFSASRSSSKTWASCCAFLNAESHNCCCNGDVIISVGL